VANLTTGADSQPELTPYSAPGTGLNWAFADITPDSLYVAATTPGVFLAAGSGNNVLQASAGQNVLAAGTGTNLLIGGMGTATFYLDGRNPGPSWSTIADFNPGDAMILWGWQGNVATLKWMDGQGLLGWQGATLHTGLYGTGSNESLTFTGLTAAQAAGFEIGAGNASGTPFLAIVRA
jgi:Ca2+-binding RTX toxin-like protein